MDVRINILDELKSFSKKFIRPEYAVKYICIYSGEHPYLPDTDKEKQNKTLIVCE